ncbi:MAG: iron-containing alcohol dehydrogenase [Phycisphaerae bacterium]|nr:iron-containing alcohol dehydrogenase [Phycisphaerae bacterium]
MHFEFATAGRIIFGEGTLREVGPAARALVPDTAGGPVLVVTGRSSRAGTALLNMLDSAGLSAVTFAVAGEPTIPLVRKGTRFAREHGCNLVIGLGGGSAVDTAKAIAALLTNEGDVLDYLEVIGRSLPLRQPPVPCIAIPTTAGTGAEVTRNAVLGSPEHQVKVSLRHPLMLPRIAIVDPELTYDLPAEVTASTGLDALTQLLEAYVSGRANPLTDAICREGLQRAARSLVRACQEGRDAAARRDMALASLFGGLALANAGLGAAHGFAGPIGGMFDAPHGAVCAALLPHVMAVNVRALGQRVPEHAARQRYDEVAGLLTGKPAATAEQGIQWVGEVCRTLHIPGLRCYGVQAKDLPTLVEKGAAASSMKANPIVLAEEELHEILTRAL